MHVFTVGSKGMYTYKTGEPYKVTFRVEKIDKKTDIATVELMDGTKVEFDREHLNEIATPLDKVTQEEMLEMMDSLTINLVRMEGTLKRMVLNMSDTRETVKELEQKHNSAFLRSLTKDTPKEEPKRTLKERLLGIG